MVGRVDKNMEKPVCVRYKPEMQDDWDRIVEESRNGTFLINRQYLDYHSDRFCDHSLVIEVAGERVALLPANEQGTTLYSHQGLTYGGLIMTSKCKGALVLKIFEEIIKYLRDNGFTNLIYKPIPHIYHTLPAEEDEYALYRHGALIEACGISSTIDLRENIQFSSMRSRGVKKAISKGVEVCEEEDYSKFWDILTTNLEVRHSVKPVHTLQEIEMLKKRFPQNIRLFVAKHNDKTLAGVVIYETPRCVHCQYIASSPEGRNLGALDMIFSHLIKEQYKDEGYFDFGISTEDNGKQLNEGLLSQKEGFGATATLYKTYKIVL